MISTHATKNYGPLCVLLSLVAVCAVAAAVLYIDSIQEVLYLLDWDMPLYRQWFPRFYLAIFAAAKGGFPLLMTGLWWVVLRLWLGRQLSAVVVGLHFLLAFGFGFYQGPVQVMQLASLITAAALVFYYRVGLAGVVKRGFYALYAAWNKGCRGAQNGWRGTLNILSAFSWEGLFPLLVVSLVIARVYLVFVSDNFTDVDAACRLIDADYWARYLLHSDNYLSILNPNPDWLPLYFYMAGGVLKISGSVLWLRVFHVAFSLFGALFIYRLAGLVANRGVARLAVVAYLVYPSATVFSLQTMSEPIYGTLLLGVVYFFVKGLQSGQRQTLVYEVLLLNAATLVRYEAWSLPVLLAIVHTVMRKGISRQRLAALALSYMGAAMVCLTLWLEGFHPLRGILFSDFQVEYTYTYHDSKERLAMLQALSPAWIPFSVLSALALLGMKRYKHLWALSLLSLLYISPYLYKLITYTTLPQHRYLVQYELLFLIPLMFVLYKGVQRVFAGKNIQWLTGLAGIAALMASSYWLSKPVVNPLPDGYKASVQVARALPQGGVVLDYLGCDMAYHWMVETDIPFNIAYTDTFLKDYMDFDLVRKRNAETKLKKGVVFLVGDYFHEFGGINYEQLYTLMQQQEDLYLVLFPEGDLDKYFQFTEPKEIWRDMTFVSVFSKDNYRIYKKAK